MTTQKPKYFKHFDNGKFFDAYLLDFPTAYKIRNDFCEYFQVPNVIIMIDDVACDREDAGGFYLSTFHSNKHHDDMIVLRHEMNLWVLLHELTHHIQKHLYDCDFIDDEHGPTFIKAKNRTVTWAKKNISDHIKSTFLNAY